MLFKCKTCEVLKAENEYLRKLVDNLLLAKGIKAVNLIDEPIGETEEEKEDRALKERGAVRYGD